MYTHYRCIYHRPAILLAPWTLQQESQALTLKASDWVMVSTFQP